MKGVLEAKKRCLLSEFTGITSSTSSQGAVVGHHDADVHTVLSSSSTNAPHSVSVQTDLTLEEVGKLEVTNGMWLNDAISVIQENDRLRQQTIELKLKLDAITFSKVFFLTKSSITLDSQPGQF